MDNVRLPDQDLRGHIVDGQHHHLNLHLFHCAVSHHPLMRILGEGKPEGIRLLLESNFTSRVDIDYCPTDEVLLGEPFCG